MLILLSIDQLLFSPLFSAWGKNAGVIERVIKLFSAVSGMKQTVMDNVLDSSEFSLRMYAS